MIKKCKKGNKKGKVSGRHGVVSRDIRDKRKTKTKKWMPWREKQTVFTGT